MRDKLTDRYAASAPPGLHWDADRRAPNGFLLRVTPAGARAWCLNYRVKDSGRERRITIGSFPDWSTTQARERAAKLRRQVDAGQDPLGDLEQKRSEPSVAELVERFKTEALPSRAPRTRMEYAAMLEQYIVPAIGRLKVGAVEREDVAKLHRRISLEGKKRRANAVLAVAHLVFQAAIEWRYRSDNPCRGAVKRNPEHGRERYLDRDELDRLMTTLERWRERKPDSADAIALLAMTGARRGELLNMRWDDVVDLHGDAPIWVKPSSVTKERKLRRIPLSVEAAAILRRRTSERDAPGSVVALRRNDHVFKGGGDGAHVNRLERDWREFRAAAGLENCRIHDLRHSYASLLVGEGLSLPIIGALLGHEKIATTQRYSHLALDPLREATAVVGRVLGGKMTTR